MYHVGQLNACRDDLDLEHYAATDIRTTTILDLVRALLALTTRM